MQVKAIIRIFKYIKETLNYNIYYEDKENLIKYIDVNFARTMNNHCFINNYTFFYLKILFKFKILEFNYLIKLPIKVCYF